MAASIEKDSYVLCGIHSSNKALDAKSKVIAGRLVHHAPPAVISLNRGLPMTDTIQANGDGHERFFRQKCWMLGDASCHS